MSLPESFRLYTHLALIRLRRGSPRNYTRTWDSFWATVHNTGRGGEVLWDNEPERASAEDLARFKLHMEPGLPLLDLGCGNGRQTRFLARHFPRVVGVDVSPSAVELARRETDAAAGISYRVLDGTHPDQARAIHDEFGDLNIYMRTVLHVIQPADRPRFVESLEILLGERGTLYQIELATGALGFFRSLPGDSPSGLPWLVHNVIQHGPRPFGFDLDERDRLYPAGRWTVLDQGRGVTINTIPLSHGVEGPVPANYLVLRHVGQSGTDARSVA